MIEDFDTAEKYEHSYWALTDKEKVELFKFVPDDNNYNLELHMAVLKACGLKLDFDEVYEDYQKIYDKTMEMIVCPSAKEGVCVADILREIINSQVYKSDYEDITMGLLFVPVGYETVIQSLQNVLDSGMWES